MKQYVIVKQCRTTSRTTVEAPDFAGVLGLISAPGWSWDDDQPLCGYHMESVIDVGDDEYPDTMPETKSSP